MKYVSIFGFAFLVSACSFSLGADKLNVDAKSAKRQEIVRKENVTSSREDAFLIKRYFV